MTDHSRHAVYYIPPEGPLAEFGARWLGWDPVAARAVPSFDVDRLDEMVATPRKYGFHATLKPPFRLAPGRTAAELGAAVAALAARTPPARASGLRLARLGRFLALVVEGAEDEIARVAAACVRDLDAFRAAPGPEELARRDGPHLDARRRALLHEWGYPHVLDAFRSHMTLTGKLPKADLPAAEAALRAYLPPLPAPFVMGEIALLGERPDGRFELISRHALTG
ncbi:Protein of unknown function [Roseivivax lentus]|uniref:Phosphonate metabolism protein n=1 Tax=Roseivivax lentus TaxID=633194 RepID=A0A1N7N915_9RHOB|nr:DUF1045 domain-containing protein [Roseivivax lentus]SIS94816.1 Protein of unknown function [Roseivivax lentus]